MILPPIKALGTVWHIEVFDSVCDQEKLHVDCTKWLLEYESRYSRFLPDSWLTELNQKRIFKNPHRQFVDLLQLSLEYFEKTERVFNIAIGENLTQAGYDASYSFVSSQKEIDVPNLPSILSVTDEAITLTKGQLDLGGIGKGYAIDALAAHLQVKHGISYFIINGGGDMYVTSDNGQPISITLAHPTDHTLGIGTIDLFEQGFAASSPYVRTWTDRVTGKVYNHLLTNKNIASYVVASNACIADVWATTCAIESDCVVPSEVEVLLLENTHVVRSSIVFRLHTQNHS